MGDDVGPHAFAVLVEGGDAGVEQVGPVGRWCEGCDEVVAGDGGEDHGCDGCGDRKGVLALLGWLLVRVVVSHGGGMGGLRVGVPFAPYLMKDVKSQTTIKACKLCVCSLNAGKGLGW